MSRDDIKLARVNAAAAREADIRALVRDIVGNPVLQFAALYYLTEYMVDIGVPMGDNSRWKWNVHTGEALMIGAGAIATARALAPVLPTLGQGAGAALSLIPKVV